MGMSGQNNVIEKMKKAAGAMQSDLTRIRRELHRHPELGMELPKTHEIISRELRKIPGLQVYEHRAGGSGIIAVMRGGKGAGKTVLMRADIDALPIEEKTDRGYRSMNPGRMHACGHDGHAAWLIGAAKLLSLTREEWGGCIKFVFQPREEIGKGADILIGEDKVLEDPPVDMAFAAANEIYQHIPAILARKIGGTESKVMSVTYMQAGDPKVRNIIPAACEFGGTMRAAKKETLEIMGRELKKETEAVCRVYGASCEVDVRTHGGAVENAPGLLEGVRNAAAEVLGREQVYIIEEDNLGGENFAEYSSRVPSVYMFIGIKPADQQEAPGLHSPQYRFDDQVLAGAAGTFAAIGYYGCMGMLERA